MFVWVRPLPCSPLCPLLISCCVGLLQVQAFEATVAKEQKEMQQTAAAAFGGAKKKLTDKFKAIEELNTKYQQVCAYPLSLLMGVELRRSPCSVCHRLTCKSHSLSCGACIWQHDAHIHQQTAGDENNALQHLLKSAPGCFPAAACLCLQDLKAAWDDYSALYTRLDDTTRKVCTRQVRRAQHMHT